jgi:mRNA interferase MazF
VTPSTFSRGDVVLTRFPFTDLTGASLRPAVVVSSGQIGQDIVLAAVSSVVRAALAPTDYKIETTNPEFALTGLRVTSVLRIHKLAAVEHSIIVRRLGRLGPQLI